MLPRLKLIQCFTCKNNLDCWGLNEDIPLGLNNREYSIKSQALNALVINSIGDTDLFISEQFGIISASFLQTLRFDHQSSKRDIYQLINALCALCNTPDDTWTCPGENPEGESEFVYEARS